MTEGTYDIVCQQGASFARMVGIAFNGVPMDLTGYSAKLQARRTHETKAVLVELTSETDGGIVINGVQGQLSIAMTPTQTAALPAVSGVYDLLLTGPAPSTDTVRWLEGKFTVSAGVTRAA